jgi:hypothetical protein
MSSSSVGFLGRGNFLALVFENGSRPRAGIPWSQYFGTPHPVFCWFACHFFVTVHVPMLEFPCDYSLHKSINLWFLLHVFYSVQILVRLSVRLIHADVPQDDHQWNSQPSAIFSIPAVLCTHKRISVIDKHFQDMYWKVHGHFHQVSKIFMVCIHLQEWGSRT